MTTTDTIAGLSRTETEGEVGKEQTLKNTRAEARNPYSCENGSCCNSKDRQ